MRLAERNSKKRRLEKPENSNGKKRRLQKRENESKEQGGGEEQTRPSRLGFRRWVWRTAAAVGGGENGDGCDDPLKTKEGEEDPNRPRLSFVLPRDLLENTLLRLPPKDLMRLRPVCRGWRDCIDDDRFAAAHRTRPRDSLPFLLRRHGFAQPSWHLYSDRDRNNPELEIVVPLTSKEGDRIALLSSLNGLLLFCRQQASSSEAYFYVGNPISGEFVALPPVSNCYQIMIAQLMEDDDSGVHKVLVIHCKQDSTWKVTTLIYTLSIDVAWRNFPNLYDGCLGWWCFTVMFPRLNGALHCVHDDDKLRYCLGRPRQVSVRFVAAFDSKEERLREMGYPHRCCPARNDNRIVDTNGYYHSTDLVELSQKLCLLHFDPEMKVLDAWLLDDYCSHVWRKHHSINFGHLYKELPFEFDYIPSKYKGIYAYAKLKVGDLEDDDKVLLNYCIPPINERPLCTVHLCYHPGRKTVTMEKLEFDRIEDLGTYEESLVRVSTPCKTQKHLGLASC